MTMGCAVVLFTCLGISIVGGMIEAMRPKPASAPTAAAAATSKSPASVDPKTATASKMLGVAISNRYAESIFTLDVTQRPDASLKKISNATPLGKRVRVADKVRIAGHSVERFDYAMPVHPGASLELSMTAISLGEPRRFTFKVEPSMARVLQITYDYDLALAQFSISYGWRD